MLGHEVNFHDSSALGLDDYDVNSRVVMPAWRVKNAIKPRYAFDAKFTQDRFEEAKKFLEDLGSAMVEVVGCGIAAGDYLVRPVLISYKQWLALEKLGAV